MTRWTVVDFLLFFVLPFLVGLFSVPVVRWFLGVARDVRCVRESDRILRELRRDSRFVERTTTKTSWTVEDEDESQ